MFKKIGSFVKDVQVEMGRVSWSTREELVGSTVVVLVSLAILSVFIGICDIILSKIVNIIMIGL